LFLDEANRLSRDNLGVLFDLCRSLELQLLVRSAGGCARRCKHHLSFGASHNRKRARGKLSSAGVVATPAGLVSDEPITPETSADAEQNAGQLSAVLRRFAVRVLHVSQAHTLRSAQAQFLRLLSGV